MSHFLCTAPIPAELISPHCWRFPPPDILFRIFSAIRQDKCGHLLSLQTGILRLAPNCLSSKLCGSAWYIKLQNPFFHMICSQIFFYLLYRHKFRFPPIPIIIYLLFILLNFKADINLYPFTDNIIFKKFLSIIYFLLILFPLFHFWSIIAEFKRYIRVFY